MTSAASRRDSEGLAGGPCGRLGETYWWNEKTETMHDVPVKLAMELGVGPGLAWVLATAVALH